MVYIQVHLSTFPGNQITMKRRKSLLFLYFSLLVVIVTAVIFVINFYLVRTRKTIIRAEMETIAGHHVTENMQSITFLASVWDSLIVANGGAVQDFSNRSEKILKDFNHKAVESLRVAPDGVVQYVYPYSFSSEIGMDLSNSSILKDIANRSRYTGMDTISEPEMLEDGGYRMTVIHPVYIKDRVGKQNFWGFSLVTILTKALFDDSSLAKLGFHADYRISRMNEELGDEVFIDTAGKAMEDPVYYYFSALNGTMYLTAQWEGGWITATEKMLEIVIGVSIVVLGCLMILLFRFRSNMKVLSRISYTDELTGLNNRHRLRELFEKLDGQPRHVCILFMDFDHFKLINDNIGHDAGDEALRQGARFFAGLFGNESCFRYGGDEFLILMENKTDEEALAKASHIKDLKKITFQDTEIPVSVSGGFASGECATSSDLRALIRMADENLYQAKETGRSRICGGNV